MIACTTTASNSSQTTAWRSSSRRLPPRDVHLAALERAKARLDTLDLYPRPVGIRHVRLWVWPSLFRLPWFRRFDGYSAWGTVILREPVERAGDDLVTHELCHVWQMQHRPFAMPLSYLRGYDRNPYELEARQAVDRTR